MAAREREANFNIGGFANVAIGAKMPERSQIVARQPLEDVAGITAKNLGCRLKKDASGRRQQAADRESGIPNAILSVEEVLVDQRPIDPREHVPMLCIHLPETSSHSSTPQQKAGGQ